MSGPDFCSTSEHTRSPRGKPAHCVECLGLIVEGQRYVITSGSWEGEFTAFKRHKLCEDISRAQIKNCAASGLSEDCFPEIGRMVEFAAEEMISDKTKPPYWPAAVDVSHEALRMHLGVEHYKAAKAA